MIVFRTSRHQISEMVYPIALLATATGMLNTLRQVGGVLGIAVVVAALSTPPT